MGEAISQVIGVLLLTGFAAFWLFFLLCLFGVVRISRSHGHNDGPGSADIGGE